MASDKNRETIPLAQHCPAAVLNPNLTPLVPDLVIDLSAVVCLTSSTSQIVPVTWCGPSDSLLHHDSDESLNCTPFMHSTLVPGLFTPGT